jgi:hypothetical protein
MYNDEFAPLKCCSCGATIGNACDPFADPGCSNCDRLDQEAEYEHEIAHAYSEEAYLESAVMTKTKRQNVKPNCGCPANLPCAFNGFGHTDHAVRGVKPENLATKWCKRCGSAFKARPPRPLCPDCFALARRSLLKLVAKLRGATLMTKVYTDEKCPSCGQDLFSSVAPWEVPKGTKIRPDTCLTHGKQTFVRGR